MSLGTSDFLKSNLSITNVLVSDSSVTLLTQTDILKAINSDVKTVSGENITATNTTADSITVTNTANTDTLTVSETMDCENTEVSTSFIVAGIDMFTDVNYVYPLYYNPDFEFTIVNANPSAPTSVTGTLVRYGKYVNIFINELLAISLSGSSVQMTTLPVEYRPSRTVQFQTMANIDAIVRFTFCKLDTTGVVTLYAFYDQTTSWSATANANGWYLISITYVLD